MVALSATRMASPSGADLRKTAFQVEGRVDVADGTISHEHDFGRIDHLDPMPPCLLDEYCGLVSTKPVRLRAWITLPDTDTGACN